MSESERVSEREREVVRSNPLKIQLNNKNTYNTEYSVQSAVYSYGI